MYNTNAVIRLKRICTDCYNMYREVEVFNQCNDITSHLTDLSLTQQFCLTGTEQCFTSKTFLNCVKSLLIDKSEAKYMAENIG